MPQKSTKSSNRFLLIFVPFVPLCGSAALVMAVTIVVTMASPCGKSGMTVLRSNDGSSFLFYLFREAPDIYFDLSGKEISFPNGHEGPRRFVIDGVMYESLMLKPTFMKLGEGNSDLEILKGHQRYAFDYILKSPSPLKQFVELGPRTKRAANGQPGFTFYLWMARVPDDSKGPRQYFLTSVTSGEVVVLTAIVPNESADRLAMQAFESYASSFQHVLKKAQCPEAARK